jgi:hypothetical protein
VGFDAADDGGKFNLYSTNTNNMTVSGGVLASRADAEMKAILKSPTSASDVDVSVRVRPGGSNGAVNGGLYVLATGTGGAQDQISAYNVNLQSEEGSRDLVVSLHKFDRLNGYEGAIVSVTLYGYYQDAGNKPAVAVRAVTKDGRLNAFIDGKQLWQNFDVSDLKGGVVGLRSQNCDLTFDEFRLVSGF